MEFVDLSDDVLRFNSFMAVTIGIIVLFIGKRINDAVGFLREFSIPEPVTGGLLLSIVFGLVYALTGTAVEFDLTTRDVLLVYFFTTIGINASLKDLLNGGKPLVTLAGYPVGVDICYEDAYASEIIRALPEATLLINASNDAWFGDSLAPH